MNILRAVFWDVDGTIADTELDGHREAFNRSFADYDLNWFWDQSIYRKLLKISGGLNRIKFYNNTSKSNFSEELCSNIQLRKGYHYNEIVKSGLIRPREGVIRLLNELSEKGVKQYIVTTSGIASLKPLLKTVLCSSNELFSGIISFEDVGSLKPHPEAYLKALKYSGLPAENCLAIEDSSNGVSSAISAKLKCLMTPPVWYKQDEIKFEQANSCVDSLGSFINPSKLIYGKPLKNNKLVDFNYLSELIK